MNEAVKVIQAILNDVKGMLITMIGILVVIRILSLIAKALTGGARAKEDASEGIKSAIFLGAGAGFFVFVANYVFSRMSVLF